MTQFLIKLTFIFSIFTISHSNAANAQDAPEEAYWNQADAIFGKDAMAQARKQVLEEGGAQYTLYGLVNQFEYQKSGDEEGVYWNAQLNWGGDIHKLWLKSEGHGSLDGDGLEEAEVQVLYSRAISPFWNLQSGLRYDFEPKGLVHGVVAITGLAPYWLEIDAAAFLSEKGDLSARIEGEYELRLNQKLILQPRIEANFAAQKILERQLGAGLNSLEAGLRLRYEIRPEFAPYIGVNWRGHFGETKALLQSTGHGGQETAIVLGIRAWY